MAATVSWEGLRELAGFRAEKGCAISLYVNLDPSVSPTPGDAQTRVRSLLDEGKNGFDRARLSHDQRGALKADLERIRRYFEEQFSRDGARGVAVFCAGLDNFWRPLQLAEPVLDHVKVGREFFLAPLVPLVGRGEGALVALVSRERGQVYRLRAGRLEEVADQFDEQPRRHDQGGWSQARFERHVDELAQRHLRDVADLLDRLARRMRGSCTIVVACTDDTRAEFAELLSNDVRGAVIGWTQAEAHASPPELHELARPLLEEWRSRREGELVERWREETGRNGRATAGWASTLEAASDGRVDVLLYREGVEHPAWRCPACGRLALEGGKCPLDSTALEEQAEGLDLAVHQTLAHGGTVWAVRHRQDLEPLEGVGAVLRY